MRDRSERSRGGSGQSPPLTRRAVLRAGTLGAAAVGAAGMMPGLVGSLAGAAPEASGLAAEATEAAPEASGLTAEVSGPIVAHITDASAGELSLYIGENQIAYRDPALVARLLRAGR